MLLILIICIFCFNLRCIVFVRVVKNYWFKKKLYWFNVSVRDFIDLKKVYSVGDFVMDWMFLFI